MFERFFRASNAINYQGTGLGLTIVKRYLDLLGGSIRFDSELNKGTSFVVHLPLISDEAV
jgi:signal transduction histidine kinase